MGASGSQTDDTNTLDLETLKVIHDNIKTSVTDIEDDHILHCLKQTALEGASDDEDIQELFKRKHYALKCLNLLPRDLSDDFCLMLFNGLFEILNSNSPELEESLAFQKLYDYVIFSTNIEKLLLFQTITLCLAESEVNFSIFETFPASEWVKELLIFALFNESNAETDTVQRVINKINYVCDEISSQLVTDTLEILVCNQSTTDFDVDFINDVFLIISRQPDFLIMLSHNFPLVLDEINNTKLNMLYARYGRFAELETFDSELKYFLKYPLDVIQAITAEKKIYNLMDLVDLKRILEICDMDLTTQVKLLLQIDPDKTIDKWKYEIGFEIVKNIITDVFPAYERYMRQLNHADETVNCVYTISKPKIECCCFNPNKKCLLHHTTECSDLLYVLNSTIARVIFNCSHPSEKVLEVIGIIISGINKAKRIIELIHLLDTLEDYNIQFTDTELYNFFAELISEDYEREVHKHIVEHSFPGTYEKTIDQLLNEIEEMNPRVTNSIIEQFSNIQSCYDKNSVLFPQFGIIKKWDRAQITMWSAVKRQNNNIVGVVTDEEILAVIKRAAKVTVKLELRDVQLLTVLAMINSDKGRGRLAQVNTGEGKTLVIAILAAYCVFKGHKVDIFTSSPLLAIPQSEEFQSFYELCGISVAHNILPNSRYEYDILYGTNNSFQRDVLQDEFRKSGVRKNRHFDVAIVDEVDNMLIDGNNWILKLSCDMPAMDYLEVLLAAIYIQVNEAASLLTERNGEVFFLSQDNAIDEQGNVKPEVDVQEVPIEGTIKDFIIQCTESHIRKLIRDTENCEEIDKDYPEIKIPEHLREVISKVQLRKWIVSAINSIFSYVNGEDYIIKDGKVTIVDADNTGVVKKDSHWCSGLHQFLEIKHGARVQQESFTTNFISNVGLFTRYSKIYGLTGTLGSGDTRSFLQTTYDVDSVIIPPFKLKQHVSLKAIIIGKGKDKYMEIAKSCMRKLSSGRAVLVIMKYIKETDELAKYFTKTFNYESSKVKLFKTDDDLHIVERTLKPGDVIITTNIAGRGTDIKVSDDVEKNGGLHVCLTFLPVNSRVEQQNIGRTSRKGYRGTSQLVLYDPEDNVIEVIKAIRGDQETRIMRGALETVRRIKVKDKIFKKFCDLLGEIEGRNAYTKKIELVAVEERFAIWLLINENKLHNCSDEIFEAFESFKMEINRDDEHNKLIKNSYMYVQLGNNYLNEKKFEEAIEEYTSAILLDHNFAEHAYYNRAWAYIGKYGHDIDTNKHFINEAERDLKKARNLINSKEYSLHLLQTASKGEVFSEQITHKLNLYSIQKNTIELAIGPDIEAIDEQLKRLKEDKNDEKLSSDYKNKISDAIKNLEESKNDVGVIGRAKKNNRNLQIEALGDDYMPTSDIESHKNEIAEFKRNGWIGGFKITEIKPIDWTTVISLLGIGLGQLIIGAALTVFTLGAGASIGMAFISEGVSDIITAIKDGIINREFDWATWALMKVISITISIVCAGFKAIKDVARTAYSGAKNVVTSGASAFNQVTKQGWKIVAKKIGVDLAKGVAKEIITDLVNYGIDKTVLPMIEGIIIENVRKPIQEALIKNEKVVKMLKLDEKNHNHDYEHQIRLAAQTLLSPKTNSKLETIAKQIEARVLANKGLALTQQVCTGIISTCELVTFTSDFICKMNQAIDKIKIDINTNDSTNNNETFNEVESEHLQQACDAKETDDKIDLNRLNQQQEQVKLKEKVHTTDNLSNQISSMVSTKMLHILKGDIIAPITQMGVNYSVDKLSSRVSGTLDKEVENYRSLKNVIHYQNKAYNNTDINLSQTHVNDDIKKVDTVIDGVKNGGPAGLVHLGAISDVTDRPIKVYDEQGRHKYTIGDTKKAAPIEIQYHEAPDGGTGHFTLKGCREPFQNGAASNMCLFNVIAEQTGHNPNELKTKTLNVMEKNKSTIAKQVKHINRLEMYDRSSLLEGGARYDGQYPDDAGKYARNSNGVIGFGNIKAGHADIHIPFKDKTIDRLNAVAEETGRHIEVYDKEGNLAYIIGSETKGVPPIELEYHKPEGDTSGEYFSSKGGTEKYYFRDPNDMHFYNIISKQTKHDASALKTATRTRMDQIHTVAPQSCIETETRVKKQCNTAFMSEEERDYVLHHALQTKTAKDAMDELNKYKPGVNDSEDFTKHKIRISAAELNLPRSVYGGVWKNGKHKLSWPVTDVMLVLQHYEGSQNDPNAPVHVQTFYPFRPGK